MTAGGDTRMRVVSFKIDEGLLAMLEEFAKRKGVAKSVVIRWALRHYLEQAARAERPYITRRVRVY